MKKQKHIISIPIQFSHPLSMRFSGRKWYDDDEYEWCDNRIYFAENVCAYVYVYSNGSCKLHFGKKYGSFINTCKEKQMMPKTQFNSIKELVKYFLTDTLFELPLHWKPYMETRYCEVKKYSPQHVKRHFSFDFRTFKFTEFRGEFQCSNKNDIEKYADVCPLPNGISWYGYAHDEWAKTHGYIEIGEHCYWDKTLDNYVVYNITEHNVDDCINKYFDDFYIYNELDFYKYMQTVDSTLDHSVVYRTYRNSFNSYKDGLTYKDKKLDFDKIFSVYVEQSNIAQQNELDELNRQIAELEAKRSKCFKNYG